MITPIRKSDARLRETRNPGLQASGEWTGSRVVNKFRDLPDNGRLGPIGHIRTWMTGAQPDDRI
jgi:hypothetical protein